MPARILAVSSLLPPSTTTSSMSHGYGTSKTRVTADASVAASLNTGNRIESFTFQR